MVGIGKDITRAYGLFIDIDGPSAEAIVKTLMTPAEKTIEVAVRYRGVTKEYTLADFLSRLGHYDFTT